MEHSFSLHQAVLHHDLHFQLEEPGTGKRRGLTSPGGKMMLALPELGPLFAFGLQCTGCWPRFTPCYLTAICEELRIRWENTISIRPPIQQAAVHGKVACLTGQAVQHMVMYIYIFF